MQNMRQSRGANHMSPGTFNLDHASGAAHCEALRVTHRRQVHHKNKDILQTIRFGIHRSMQIDGPTRRLCKFGILAAVTAVIAPCVTWLSTSMRFSSPSLMITNGTLLKMTTRFAQSGKRSLKPAMHIEFAGINRDCPLGRETCDQAGKQR